MPAKVLVTFRVCTWLRLKLSSWRTPGKVLAVASLKVSGVMLRLALRLATVLVVTVVVVFG